MIYLQVYMCSMWGQIHLVEQLHSHFQWHTDEKSYATVIVTVPVYRLGYYYFQLNYYFVVPELIHHVWRSTEGAFDPVGDW